MPQEQETFKKNLCSIFAGLFSFSLVTQTSSIFSRRCTSGLFSIYRNTDQPDSNTTPNALLDSPTSGPRGLGCSTKHHCRQHLRRLCPKSLCQCQLLNIRQPCWQCCWHQCGSNHLQGRLYERGAQVGLQHRHALHRHRRPDHGQLLPDFSHSHLR